MTTETTTKVATATTKGATNYVLVGSYATIAGLWGASQVVYIPYFVHLLLLVTAILYAACHSSLVLLEEEAPPLSGDTSEHGMPSSTRTDRETLTSGDAYQFPLVGSVSLFSLYLAFKFLDENVVNMMIGGYFGVVGAFALTMTVKPTVEKITPAAMRRSVGWDYSMNHKLPEWLGGETPWDLSVQVTGVEVISFLVAAGVCFFYFQSKPWYLNNIIGISFCLQGIEKFSLGTYKIGAILLVGLFFYDIFWVFGTEGECMNVCPTLCRA